MKILPVDDSRAIAMITTARLESSGHEVRHAINGPTAIELFQKESFDLILMDIEMPGMNGFETTTRIRSLEGHEQWAWTPITFVTATDSDDNLVTAIEAGGDDFISKGVAESVLQAKMKAMSRIATLRSRLAQANNRLQDQANHDGLTGLYNRRAMDMRVGPAVGKCRTERLFLRFADDRRRSFQEIQRPLRPSGGRRLLVQGGGSSWKKWPNRSTPKVGLAAYLQPVTVARSSPS